jgi:beta-glucosidase
MQRRINIFGLFLLITSFVFAQTAKTPVYLDNTKPIEMRVNDALLRMTLKEKVAMVHAQSKFSSAGCPRLGIPEIWMSDGPHGIRQELNWNSFSSANWTNDSCTAFPALTCLGATFNPDLAYEYGNAIGQEARYRKKDILLAPGVNIYRSPMNGRNFEYMGEDPYLTSKLVVPYIQGVQKNGVSACVKHFALNNQEQWRGSINVELSDRALYEIYLPAFKASILEGKTWAIMGSYNKMRGQHCSENDILLNKILKGEWNFDGVVVSDWDATHDTSEAVENGLDIEMGTWKYLPEGKSLSYDGYYLANPYLEGLEKGKYTESGLNEKVKRILRLCFRTNMSKNRPYGSFVTKEHADVARRIAEEGIVLLKNQNNFFPIPKNKYKKILVIGENATKSLTVGGGSSELKVKKEVSPLDGLIAKYGDTSIVYSRGYSSNASKSEEDSLKLNAIILAKDAEVVIFIGGLNKNIGQDCEGEDRISFDLPYSQNKLIEDLLDVNKNMGIIIISGNGVAMPWVYKVPALIQSWYLGSEAGYAITNVISGEVNPSGKLPFSIPKKLADNCANYFGKDTYPGNGTDVIYQEDIFVGYRWYDTKKIATMFPFGYGLSYTVFDFGKVSANKKEYNRNDTIKVSFTLTNKGKIDGAESVQIYSSQEKPTLPRPIKELKSFKKVFLKAGETKYIELSIPVTDLAFFNDKLHEWVVESDKYTLHCATSAADIKSSITIAVK